MNISSVLKFRSVTFLLLIAILVSACGSGETAPTDPPPEPVAPTETSVPPTDAPAPSPTPEPEIVAYTDPAGDCLDNDNNATACVPSGVDIHSVTISRESPLTIVLEIDDDGFDALRANGFFGVIFGFDLDQNLTTGHTSFWPDFHGIGPDIEIRYVEEEVGVVAEAVTLYAPGGTLSEGDASQVTWTVLDNNHMQIVISEELIPDQPFSVAGDVFTPDLYDHFVDDGHLTFPDGEANLVN